MSKWVFALVCALGVGGNAQADFSVYADALGEVVQTGGVFGISDLFDHESLATSFPDASTIQVVDGNLGIGLGYAAAHATATFGEVSASANASCAENPDDFPVASATGRGRADVYDTLHVQSPTLPNGTPVTFDIDYDLTTNYSSPADDPNGFFFSSVFATLDAQTSVSGHGVHLEFANDNPGAAVLSGTLDAQVGEDVTLHYLVDAHPFVAAAGSADGLQDAVTGRPRMTLGTGTPSVSAVADSGHDYGQLVPEPAEVEAELAAVVALVLVERRGRA
jgi:hypothetical protein